MIVNIDDDWKSSVFRDFEDLQAAWNVYSGRSDVVALVHVGITRPEIDLIDSALLIHKGFVFMTAAARWIFCERADFFDQEVCEINRIPTYAVINGWGYTKAKDDISQLLNIDALPAKKEAKKVLLKEIVSYISSDWIIALSKTNPDQYDELKKIGIEDDSSYLSKEQLLIGDIRQRIGYYRYRFLSYSTDQLDPVHILRACPPYIHRISLSDLNLNVRTTNVFNSLGLRLVSDLKNYSSSELLKLPNFGKGCLINLARSLIKRISDVTRPLVFSEVSLDPENLNEIELHPSAISSDWIDRLKHSHPELHVELLQLGISTDREYIDKESTLSSSLRHKVGLFRFEFLSNGIDIKDPLAIINIAPPSILDVPVLQLRLGVRTLNVLQANDIARVGEIRKFSKIQLLNLPSFGMGSLYDLAGCLYKRVTKFYGSVTPDQFENPNIDGAIDFGIVAPSNIDGFGWLLAQSLDTLDEKIRKILILRMGYKTASETLQEIADKYDITRERIRQIEVKGLVILRNDDSLGAELEKRIESLLASRPESGLSLRGIAILDSWFQGVEKLEQPLAYIFDRLLDKRLNLVKLNSQIFIARAEQFDIDEYLRSATHLFESGAKNRWSAEECKRQLYDLIPKSISELRSEFWIALLPSLVFGATSDGKQALIGVGRSIELLIETILNDSDIPLHYSDCVVQLQKRFGRESEERRVLNVMNEIALRFGPGTYGLMRHVPFSKEELVSIRTKCEEIILSGNDGRQWTCAELLEILEENYLDFDGRLNIYLVNIALAESKVLSDLKRLVWTKGSNESLGANNRLDLSQAVEALLIQNGKPMTNAEIKEKITLERGVGPSFQIHSTDSLIRVGIGEWGLIDRDLPLDTEEQKILIAKMGQILAQKKAGIHLTEIQEIMNPIYEPANRIEDPTVFFTLAQRSDSLRVSKNRYVYLKEWGDARRISLPGALSRSVLDMPPNGLTINEIIRNASVILGREIKRDIVYTHIIASGAQFDDSSGKWKLPNTIFDD